MTIDLPAFRRAITVDDTAPSPFWPPTDGGAWNDELERGMWPNHPSDGELHAEARRGAVAMRRAFFGRRWYRLAVLPLATHPGLVQAIGGIPIVPGDPRFIGAWSDERERGCPAWP